MTYLAHHDRWKPTSHDTGKALMHVLSSEALLRQAVIGARTPRLRYTLSALIALAIVGYFA